MTVVQVSCIVTLVQFALFVLSDGVLIVNI